jgi:hypothetical protein
LWKIVRIYDQAHSLLLEINKFNNYRDMLDPSNSIKVKIICEYMRELNKMIGLMENSELFIRMVQCMKVI